MVREVSLHSTRVSDCVHSQLTTALVPTVPSLCFLVQSATNAKVREIVLFVLFCFMVCQRSTVRSAMA